LSTVVVVVVVVGILFGFGFVALNCSLGKLVLNLISSWCALGLL